MPRYRYSKDGKTWNSTEHVCCAGMMSLWGDGYRHFEVFGHREISFKDWAVNRVLSVVPNSPSKCYNNNDHKYVFNFTDTDWMTAALHLYECQYITRDSRSYECLKLLNNDSSEDDVLAVWICSALRWNIDFAGPRFSMYCYGAPFGNAPGSFDALKYIWARFMEVQLPTGKQGNHGQLPHWNTIFKQVGISIEDTPEFKQFEKLVLASCKKTLAETVAALHDVVAYLKEVKHERTKNVLAAAPVPEPTARAGNGEPVQQAPAAGERQPAERPVARAPQDENPAAEVQREVKRAAPRRKYPRVAHARGVRPNAMQLRHEYVAIDGNAHIAIWRQGKKKVLPSPANVAWYDHVDEYRKATPAEVRAWKKKRGIV